MSKSIKELIQAANHELYENGNLTVIPDFFSSQYEVHSEGKIYSGHAFIKRFTRMIHKIFSNIKVDEIEFLSESKNKMTWIRTIKGTHIEAMKGIPASGRRLKWYDIVVSRFEKGKIIEEWTVSTLAAQMLLKQKKG